MCTLHSKAFGRRAAHCVVAVLALSATAASAQAPTAAENQLGTKAKLAPWQRVLRGDDAKKVETLEKQIGDLQRQGQFAEAVAPAREVLKIRSRLQGEDHWETVNARIKEQTCVRLGGLRGELQSEIEKAMRQYEESERLRLGGHFAEAEALCRIVLEVRNRILGEDHPYTAVSCNNLAVNIDEQGRYREAQPLAERALAIRRKALGEDHPETAQSHSNLAGNLQDQGRYREAQPLLERAVAIHRNALGEDDPLTAQSYNNLAVNLNAQGRYGEAQPLYQRALATLRKALGEEHPYTAYAYNNVAFNLNAQGRCGEAQPLYERALAIRRKVLGEDHPFTAFGYANLAANLDAEGRYGEAHPLHERALAIFRKALGEDHPNTAASYSNVAANLKAQGRYDEAQRLYERALAIRRNALGEDNPNTALSYYNMASNFDAQGRHDDAKPLLERALVIQRQALGEDHPRTAESYNMLAANINALGRYAEAEKNWGLAAAAFDKIRGRIAPTGLARAATAARISPFPALACKLADRGAMTEAWNSYEKDLARGLLDELSARQAHRISDQDRRREEQLFAQLKRLDTLAEKPAARIASDPQQVAARDKLTQERIEAQAAWSAFQQHLQDTYGVAEGKVFDLDQIQSQLPAAAALVGWLDLKTQPKAADPKGDHWACVVRRRGAPRWIRIQGTGPNQAWTNADDGRPDQVRKILRSGPSSTSLQPLTELAEQRLAPLCASIQARGDLPALQHLIVLPSPALAGIPIEALLEARPANLPRYLVSYAPSGTMFAWLQERRRDGTNKAGRLLALGDPVPRSSDQNAVAAPQPPAHGVLVRAVEPGSSAAAAGLRSGDVLLAYAGAELSSRDDLEKRIRGADPKTNDISIAVWREGKTLGLICKPGPLGVDLETKPAAQVILAQREGDTLLRRARGAAFAPLPGTRREVEAIAALFEKKDVLLAADASEQMLDDLREREKLKQYSVIHLATHGKMDDLSPMNSRLLLSQDRLPDPVSASIDQPFYDGTITAGEVMSTWKLDAELVTLSACQSGLGRQSGGEGFVGFSQALFLAGARSLVLSLWEVDDRATSLLMTRFYQNWLGKRPGLKKPMPKVESLREANQWLRGLTTQAVEAELKQIARGEPRPKAGQPVGGHPFEHPHYWAAFILMGDPS
jgi:CHAT domain-containing protein